MSAHLHKKSSAKQLAPGEHCLFLSEAGNCFTVVVVGKAGVSAKKLVLQSGE
jgi:hypothetical protein